jgi:glutaminyl-peptide cyclotransferase
MQTWIRHLLLAATTCALAVSPVFAQPKQLGYTLVKSYPHDRNAFTQGLLYYDGKLLESTGQYGRSELREVELETGRVIRKQRLARTDFGEGLARIGTQLVQLTWTSGHGYLWSIHDFERSGTLPYHFAGTGKAARGWGACFNNEELVVSDGSDQLYFLDRENYRVVQQLSVTDSKGAVSNLNELECIGDKIYANVWLSNRIVIIDSGSGEVSAEVDLTELYPPQKRRSANHVLNGIAWDDKQRRLFVTGKNWPKLYHIELSPVE